MSFKNVYRTALGALSKNSSRNPTPGRRHEKEPLSIPPACPNPNPVTSKDPNFMINLEDLLIIESDLHYIFENFSNPTETSKICEDLWELTADNTLNQVSSLYREDKKRCAIRYSMALQSAGLATTHYFISQYKLQQEITLLLKSIIFYIHQSFLILTKFILSRVPPDADNIWISKLSVKIQEMSLKKRCSQTTHLIRYNKSVANGLKKVCRRFIYRTEDQVLKALKAALGVILRNPEVSIQEARSGIEQALGIKRESLMLKNSIVKSPYLPEKCEKNYTLVLDLDETLVHYIENDDKGQFLTRPYAENFLAAIKPYYEIVIFTAAIQEYADWILNDLDPTGLIDFRLYRQHTIPAGNFFLKDLSNIGRDLSKVIIVDNIAENFQLQPSNGILIKSWYDDCQDTALKELSPLLIQVATSRTADVRKSLTIFREQLLEQLSKGVANPHISLTNTE